MVGLQSCLPKKIENTGSKYYAALHGGYRRRGPSKTKNYAAANIPKFLKCRTLSKKELATGAEIGSY